MAFSENWASRAKKSLGLCTRLCETPDAVGKLLRSMKYLSGI